MNEQPDNIWTRPWSGSKRVLAWLGLVAAVTFIIVFCIGMAGGGNVKVVDTGLVALLISVLLTGMGALAVLFIRWLCSWRNLKRLAFGGACLLTLVAVAYVVENVRGRAAWKSVEKLAASKGERLDLASIIPPPVPDAENVAMAPLFEGVRNEMDTEWRHAHAGPNGLTNEHRFKLTPYRTNGPSGSLPLGGWMKTEHVPLQDWQRYYRDPSWDGVPERTNAPVEPMAPSSPPRAANNEFATASQPQSPAADVLLALSKYDAVVEELRDAARRPHSRWPVRYEDNFSAVLSHLAKVKGASQLLALRAVAELGAGEPEAALADARLGLRLTDNLRGESFLISQLVRLAILNIAVQPVWEGLADRRWNEAQLAALEAELSRIDVLPDYLTAMRGERACSLEAVDYVRRTRDLNLIENGFDANPDPAKRASGALLLHLVPGGWFDQSKAVMGRLHLELFQPLVDQTNRIVSPAKVRQNGETLERTLARRTPYNIFAGMLLPALTRSAERFARGQTCANLARVACALERYRLANGSYPEKLDALTPQFLAQLPHDVINGQPLKYRRTDDGRFILYSVGWNETDDGGQVGLTSKGNVDWGKGDWVWRYPTT